MPIQLPGLIKKHILLDTCFIIKAHQYSDTKYFDELFNIFTDHDCVPVINEFIRFEFLRGCKIPKHIEGKNNFLNAFANLSLRIDNELLDDGIKIANIYSHNNIHDTQINIVDCYISAFLKKFYSTLVLVTINNPDFPLILHDRFYIHTIDTDKEIINLCFYKFNLEKFQKCLVNFIR